MSKPSFSFTNLEEIQANFDKVAKMSVNQSANALELVGLDAETVVMMGAPVDTGRLRNSITHQTTKDMAIIGTNVDYAITLEFKGVHQGWFLRAYNQVVPRAKRIFAERLKL